jgi:hypothetical protein
MTVASMASSEHSPVSIGEQGGRKVTKGGRKVTKGGRKVTKGGRKVTKGGRKVTRKSKTARYRLILMQRRDLEIGNRPFSGNRYRRFGIPSYPPRV